MTIEFACNLAFMMNNGGLSQFGVRGLLSVEMSVIWILFTHVYMHGMSWVVS